MLYSVLVSIDVLIAAGLIGLVLLQQGKGAGIGAAFGSGASGTVFGSQGSSSFLTRVTAILAALFFMNSLTLAYLASNRPVAKSVTDSAQVVNEQVQGEGNTSVIDAINKQIEEAASQQESTMPNDVPGLSNDNNASNNLPGELIENGNQVQSVQDAVDNANEAVQSMPADVPQ